MIYIKAPIILDIIDTIKHIQNPQTVGTNIESRVHFSLPLSFLIVRQVVEHGQCIKENNITHIAVSDVQPLDTKISFKVDKLSYPIKLP